MLSTHPGLSAPVQAVTGPVGVGVGGVGGGVTTTGGGGGGLVGVGVGVGVPPGVGTGVGESGLARDGEPPTGMSASSLDEEGGAGPAPPRGLCQQRQQ